MLLTALVFIPLLGAVLLAFFPKERTQEIKVFALIASLIPLALVAVLWGQLDFSQPGMQLITRAEWIPSLGISYHLGVDGISFPLIAVSALILPLAILASFTIKERVKEFFLWMLVLQTGIYGVFTALDYFLFFIFFEVSLVPMYFIIGIWGGPRREYASLKFFIYTLLGSAIMLVGILALYLGSGLEPRTFDVLVLAERANLSPTLQWWIFLAFFAGFAVKVPIFPFHTWLPDAHVEAPTGGSMILAGILLKTGTYGFFRFMLPTFPDAAQAFAPVLAVLAIINIIYGALAAMAQMDLKKLVAYSSISHMGFVILGVAAMTPMALNGAMFVNVSHGIISPLLFFVVASVIYDRTHTRMMDQMSGLFTKIPIAASITAFAAFANLGLPGMSGFPGEFFTFAGSFPVFTTLVVIGALGLVITAGYHLWMMQRVLMGEPRGEAHQDITGRELVVAAPLMVLTVLLGVLPGIALGLFNEPVAALASKLGGM
ncbi:MAG: NADH-quinone oxidoreductase subunit M [Firmicutes bacterium]|nr:NADH-quinone oxidoreductase subunit M [Bacillota bacterium]